MKEIFAFNNVVIYYIKIYNEKKYDKLWSK